MGAILNCYGRLAFDPQRRETRSGKPMVTARAAVELGRGEDQEILWLDLLAFGPTADDLAALSKGSMVSVIGRLTRSRFTTQAGEEREQYSILVDNLVSARSARPGGRKKADTNPQHQAAQRAQALAGGFFDDPMTF